MREILAKLKKAEDLDPIQETWLEDQEQFLLLNFIMFSLQQFYSMNYIYQPPILQIPPLLEVIKIHNKYEFIFSLKALFLFTES